MSSRSDTLRAYLLLSVMPLFFSTNLVIGRAAVETVAPWTLAFCRWALAGLILLPFAVRGLSEIRDALRSEARTLATLGFIGMWICGGIVYLALQATTATNATLIYATSPVFVLLIEMARGRSVALRQMAGIVAALGGIAVIVLAADLQRLLSLRFNIGDLGILVCAFAWAVYSVILKRPGLQRLPTLPLFTAIVWAGAATLLPMTLWELATVGPPPMTMRTWISVLGLAIFPSILAFGLYQIGVKAVGPAVTSIFLYFLPGWGVALAVVFLGESFQPYHLAGMVLVVAGVVAATLPARGSPRPA